MSPFKGLLEIIVSYEVDLAFCTEASGLTGLLIGRF